MTEKRSKIRLVHKAANQQKLHSSRGWQRKVRVALQAPQTPPPRRLLASPWQSCTSCLPAQQGDPPSMHNIRVFYADGRAVHKHTPTSEVLQQSATCGRHGGRHGGGAAAAAPRGPGAAHMRNAPIVLCIPRVLVDAPTARMRDGWVERAPGRRACAGRLAGQSACKDTQRS